MDNKDLENKLISAIMELDPQKQIELWKELSERGYIADDKREI